MARYIDVDKSVGIGYLSDWYQNSIDDTKPPIWTDEHIEELINDFIVIPKEAPTADVEEVRHGEWINKNGIYVCPECGCVCPYDTVEDKIQYWECLYCRRCGAKMDGGKRYDL